METVEHITTQLEDLKKSLPIYYSVNSSLKLKLKYLEYKYLLGILPENLEEIKNQSISVCYLISAKIDNCSNPAHRIARKAYQEAVGLLNTEIDSLLVRLWLERTKIPS